MKTKIKSDLCAYKFEPTIANAIFAYIKTPGFFVTTNYRLAKSLANVGFVGKILSVVIWRLNILFSGCYIATKAEINGGLHLPHPVGIVIGENVQIGKNVSIYQSVTLGADKDGIYPTIEDGVIIYANSVVVGSINIGRNSIVGASSFVNSSVGDHTVVAGIPAKVISKNAL